MAQKDRILLVDDSTLIQKVGKQILFRKGFEVILADHGEMALKLFFDQSIDLVILDYHMPKLNGLQTLHKIRGSSYKKEASVPVLILSGEEDPKEISRLLEAGADDYIYKGRLKSTPELFLEKVYSLLNYEKEVAHYKKMKLARTLPAPIKEFHAFTNNFIKHFTPSAYVDDAVAAREIPSLEELRGELSKLFDLHVEGEINETIYEVVKPDAYLLTHTVNTTLFTIMFCYFLKMEKEKVLDIAIGAFFHDFGNLKGERPMLTNPSKLDDEEFFVYMKHVERSMEATAKMKLPPEALDFIENHHERINGSGFPAGKAGVTLSQVAQIANIVVTFDALTSEKAGEPKMVAHEAIRKMQSWEGQFCEDLLKKFSEFSRQFEYKRKD